MGLFYNALKPTRGVSVNNIQQAINMSQQKFVSMKAVEHLLLTQFIISVFIACPLLPIMYNLLYSVAY